jgi:cell surface protein SprA
LNNKRVRVIARGENGRLYDLDFKVMDANSIKISNKDSVNLKLAVTQLPPLEETPWYKVAQVAARGAMMVRSAGFTYNLREGLVLPNFRPNIGDIWGQGQTNFGNAPGLDFAFGLTDESYIQKALDRDWLVKNEDNVTPAMFNTTETFTFKAALEPFVGLKIDLNAKYSTTDRKEMYFMFDAMPQKLSGMFDMTVVAIGSAFENSKSENNYKSKSFEAFLHNREVIKSRLENVYTNDIRNYPNAGFIAKETTFPGEAFDPSKGNVALNSVDVLIPAFIAAYTNKNPDKIALTAFPSLKTLLPNWKMTYEGFMQLDFINRNFKNFTLSHEYTCRYLVGSYASYQSWVQAKDDYGFIKDILTNNPTPSSPYDISAVSITEAFSPLIGLNATFKNNMSLKMEMRNTRNVNLNISSYQIVESLSDNYVIGIGYKITEFNKVLKMRHSGGAGFSNDLTISADFSYQRMVSLIRKIQDAYTQGTNGDAQTTIKISADYNLSKMLTVQAFFDRAVSEPLVSSMAYPYSKSSFGISIKLKLSR